MTGLQAAMSTAERVAMLDARFGDPWDPSNPLGHAAVLDADERGALLPAGEAMLDELGFAGELVPRALGGRLAGLDALIEMMRTVFRRDPCLGLGHSASSFIAGVNVWVGGRDDQRQRAAELLLAGRKLACGYFELAHGNDLARVELTALPHGDDALLLRGGKQAISNLARADAMVLFARTSEAAGPRAHSQLLVERAELPVGDRREPAHGSEPRRRPAIVDGPRYATAGMRGVQLGSIAFDDCPVPRARALGALGRGLEIALTSFQLTRVALPGMFLGIVDSGLRTAVRYARGRRLYDRRVLDLPLARATLVDAFVDLLAADCVSLVVSRGVHVLPREASATTAAAKFVIPRLAIDAMTGLASLLGASFYLRRGEHAIFQKLVRDLPPVSFGHLSRVAAQLSLLPQLPQFAKRSWGAAELAPASMFAIDGELPPLAFDGLALTAGGHDHATSALAVVHAALAAPHAATSEADRQALRALLGRFVAELATLKDACVGLPPHEMTATAPCAAYDLAARYAVVLAASACAAVWWHNLARDRFLRDPAWLIAALLRLTARLGAAPAPPLADDLVARVFPEVVARYDAGLGFDLAKRALAGWQRARHPDLEERQ